MAAISKVPDADEFESQNYPKHSFTNILVLFTNILVLFLILLFVNFTLNEDILIILLLKTSKKNFMAPFYGWGSTASRLEPLRGGSLLFTTKFPEIPGTHFIDLGRMEGWM